MLSIEPAKISKISFASASRGLVQLKLSIDCAEAIDLWSPCHYGARQRHM